MGSKTLQVYDINLFGTIQIFDDTRLEAQVSHALIATAFSHHLYPFPTDLWGRCSVEVMVSDALDDVAGVVQRPEWFQDYVKLQSMDYIFNAISFIKQSVNIHYVETPTKQRGVAFIN